MNTQGYKKTFCLEVHASTSAAAKHPLLLKLEEMAFYELQTEQILTGNLLLYLFFHEQEQQMSTGWMQISWHCWWPAFMAVWYHMIKMLPSKIANYMLRPTMCACICVHTLNPIGLGQYYFVLLEKVLRVSHPLGTPKPPSGSLFILYPASINSQNCLICVNPFRW